jgi:hypothetical protein
MDEAPRNQDESAAAVSPTHLSSPHFDDTAVAVAQPVEPLRPARRRFPKLSLQPILIVIAFAVVLVAVTVATAFLMPGSEPATEAKAITEQPAQSTDSERAETATTVNKAADATGATSAMDSGALDKRVVRPRRETSNARVVIEGGRPVARKVGEIRYGRP